MPGERKKSRMAAAATAHKINEGRSRSAYSHETEMSLNRGRKGPMRIDELAIVHPTVTDLTRVVSTLGAIIHRFDYLFQQQ
jgi:hypothetical protein